MPATSAEARGGPRGALHGRPNRLPLQSRVESVLWPAEGQRLVPQVSHRRLHRKTDRDLERHLQDRKALRHQLRDTFKLKDKRREGTKVLKRYHAPATPYARALAHPKVGKAVKKRLRELYRTLDPVALLAEVRAAQAELGTRIDARAGRNAVTPAAVSRPSLAADAAAFAKGLGNDVHLGEQRIIHRRMHKPYKTRVRMPSMLDPHLAGIERWLADEPRLTALAILGRLAERDPVQFGPPQQSIVQRLLRSLRRKAAGTITAGDTQGAALPVDGEHASMKVRHRPSVLAPSAVAG